MNDEWKMSPYFGVFPLVLSARKSAFSAPRICTVLAGYLARLVSEPAWAMRRAPTVSPMSVARFGATSAILSLCGSFGGGWVEIQRRRRLAC